MHNDLSGVEFGFAKRASVGIVHQETQSSFEKGVSQFTWLMIRFMIVMVPLVFLINGLTKQDWGEAFFFAMAVAVGLTPEMLPMIVTVCLSKGAMSGKRVIIKQLSAIQNLGAMDILCTDKTGTLTMDEIILEKHCDVVLQEDGAVLVLAYLNSYFQTGLKNLMDRAILDHKHVPEEVPIKDFAKIDEIPFDFSRRMMSVVVKTPEGKNRLICKGAPEAVFQRCASFELDKEFSPMEGNLIIDDLRAEYQRLNSEGFRVLAIAYKDLEPRLCQGRRERPDPARLRRLPRSAEGVGPHRYRPSRGARHLRACRHRRQRAGHAKNLSRGRHPDHADDAGQPNRKNVGR